MHVLRERFSPVPLHELPAALECKRPPRSPVAVTFDDGYADNLYQALPVLEQFEIPASFFPTAVWLCERGEFWWDELERLLLQPGSLPGMLHLEMEGKSETWAMGKVVDYTAEDVNRYRRWRAREHPPTERHSAYNALCNQLSNLPPEKRQSVLDDIREWARSEGQERPEHRRMSQEEVLTLSRSRLVDIGSHTVRHQALPTLDLLAQQREIERGKSALEELLDRPVTSFAYPHGDLSHETIRLVREAGFLRACTSRAGMVRQHRDPFTLPRFSAGNWDGNEFAKQLFAWEQSRS